MNQSYSQLGRVTTTPEPSAPSTSSTIASPARVPGVNSTSSGRKRTSSTGIVDQAVAIEELRDFIAHVHASDRRAVTVDGVARDPLSRTDDLRVGSEVRVLVVALREVERAFLLDSASELSDERFGSRQGAAGEFGGQGLFDHLYGIASLIEADRKLLIEPATHAVVLTTVAFGRPFGAGGAPFRPVRRRASRHSTNARTTRVSWTWRAIRAGERIDENQHS